MRARIATAMAAALLLAGCASMRPEVAGLVSDGRYAMGTVLEISIAGVDEARGRKVLAELFDVAERLDGLMTRYDSRSQISRLNSAAGAGPQPVDPELAELLRFSVEYATLTGGTFDVTVGPLVELWVDAAVSDEAPTEAAIRAARRRVGADAIQVTDDDRAELTRAGTVIDLGGIAKGFALDRMLPLLRTRGVEAALMNFGQSSTLGIGAPEGSPGWRLLVRGPQEELLGVVTLRDRALSISSSFGHWYEIDGERYGHVIDPRNGRPLVRPAQAVILASEATLAEALSKALLILPPDQGLALVASQPDCEALLIDAENRIHESAGWREAASWEPAGD